MRWNRAAASAPRPSQPFAWARKLRSISRRGWPSCSHSSHQSKAAFITRRARRPAQCPEVFGSVGSCPATASTRYRSACATTGRMASGESAGACSAAQLAKSYTSCSGSGPPLGAALGEPGDHQVVGVVVVGVPRPDLGEDAARLLLGAQRALQHEQPEPGRGVGRRERGGVPAGVPGPSGLLLAPQGAMDQGEGEQHRRVGGVGFGEQPLAGPGGAVGLLGEDGHPMSPAVPVVTGVDQQRPGGLPSSLGQRRAGGDEFGVVEGLVERLCRALCGRGRGEAGVGTPRLPHATFVWSSYRMCDCHEPITHSKPPPRLDVKGIPFVTRVNSRDRGHL